MERWRYTRAMQKLAAGCLMILLTLSALRPVPAGAQEHSAGVAAGLTWKLFETGSTASLRGLSALDAKTAWATGTGGTVLSTTDGGGTWSRVVIPGAEELDFRDVELFADGSAVLMTAGQPARLYRVDAGDGAVALAHESLHETAFFDAVAFWDAEHGLAFSDPVDGRFLVLRTEDGGRSWRELSPDGFPPPVEGEAGFAASGSNLAVGAGGLAWIGTGGSAARVLRSSDFGVTWEVTDAPMHLEEPTAGIFSIAFRDSRNGIAAGGDYRESRERRRNALLERRRRRHLVPGVGAPSLRAPRRRAVRARTAGPDLDLGRPSRQRSVDRRRPHLAAVLRDRVLHPGRRPRRLRLGRGLGGQGGASAVESTRPGGIHSRVDRTAGARLERPMTIVTTNPATGGLSKSTRR